jgi:hypothetical protein
MLFYKDKDCHGRQNQRRQRRSSRSSVVNVLVTSVVLLLVSQVIQFYRILDYGSSSSSRAATALHGEDLPWDAISINRWSNISQNDEVSSNITRRKKKKGKKDKNKINMMGLMIVTTGQQQQQYQPQPSKRHQQEDTEQVKVAKEMLSPEAIGRVSPQTFRQQCSSPEAANTPWPLKGSTVSMLLTSRNRTCGLEDINLYHNNNNKNHDDDSFGSLHHFENMTFVQYFRQVLIRQQIRPLLFHQMQETSPPKDVSTTEGLLLRPTCPNLVVFGVAFGESYIEEMQRSRIEVGGRVNSTAILEQNGPCFFMFTLEESMQGLFSVNNKNKNNNASTTNDDNDTATTGSTSSFPSPVLLGHNWLIPIPQRVLPYTNNRRNAKLLKYMGQYAFLSDENENEHDPSLATPGTLPSPKRIIWQDAKFFRPFTLFDQSVPIDYSKLWTRRQPHHHDQRYNVEGKDNVVGDQEDDIPVCLTTVRLPIHFSSFSQLHRYVSVGQTSRYYNHRLRGSGGDGQSYSMYREHCQTVISALRNRPNVTDSPQSLLHQCQAYIRHVQQQLQYQEYQGDSSYNNEYHNPLDYGLIDSAFMVWDESTEICRSLNRQLRCTLLDQLHCHSDRDQVLFPFVFYKLLLLLLQRQQQASSSSSSSPSNSTPIRDESRSWMFQAMYTPSNDNDRRHRIPVDQHWNGRFHDLDIVATLGNVNQPKSSPTTIIVSRTIRSACHWYHTFPVGTNDCLHYRWLPSPSQKEEEEEEYTNNNYINDKSWTLEHTAANATNGDNTTIVKDRFEDLVKSLRFRNHHYNKSTTVPIKMMGQYGKKIFARRLKKIQPFQPLLRLRHHYWNTNNNSSSFNKNLSNHWYRNVSIWWYSGLPLRRRYLNGYIPIRPSLRHWLVAT